MKTNQDLQSEIRYAIRLCERTARLYRKAQAVGTFLTVLGGSAALATATGKLPLWLTISGGVIFAIAGAALIAIRPADKAAQNEADIKKFQALLSKSHRMEEGELAEALEEARQNAAPEVETLRDVAYNDVALELGRPDAVIPLSTRQRALAFFA